MNQSSSYRLTGVVVALVAVGAVPARAEHRQGITDDIDCSACHSTTNWKLSDRAGAEGGFDHASTGFPLTGEHEKVVCTACHVPKRRIQRTCFSCHPDRHQGRQSLQCDSCHNTRSWEATEASRRHRLTRLPLTGMHAVIDCSSCHVRRSGQRYQPVPSRCFACHEDDYRGDIHPLHQGDPVTGLPAFSRECALCHQPSSWSPAFINPAAAAASVTRVPANHDRSFVLSRGAHRGALCSACHPVSTSSRIVACTGCHEHNGIALRAQHGRSVPRSATACLGCHPRGGVR